MAAEVPVRNVPNAVVPPPGELGPVKMLFRTWRLQPDIDVIDAAERLSEELDGPAPNPNDHHHLNPKVHRSYNAITVEAERAGILLRSVAMLKDSTVLSAADELRDGTEYRLDMISFFLQVFIVDIIQSDRQAAEDLRAYIARRERNNERLLDERDRAAAALARRRAGGLRASHVNINIHGGRD